MDDRRRFDRERDEDPDRERPNRRFKRERDDDDDRERPDRRRFREDFEFPNRRGNFKEWNDDLRKRMEEYFKEFGGKKDFEKFYKRFRDRDDDDDREY